MRGKITRVVTMFLAIVVLGVTALPLQTFAAGTGNSSNNDNEESADTNASVGVQQRPDNDEHDTDWMGTLNDKIPLFYLNIPGSHDSGTAHTDLNDNFARCQRLQIGPYPGVDGNQLDEGVRYFDIRLSINGSTNMIELYHGQGKTSERCKYPGGDILYMDPSHEGDHDNPGVWKWFCDFLYTHPTETIILEFSNEYSDDEAGTIYDYFKNKAETDSIVYKGAGLPTLGEARGKIVLLANLPSNKYDYTSYKNADGTFWPFPAHWASGDDANKRVQGPYQYANNPNISYISENKWSNVEEADKYAYLKNSISGDYMENLEEQSRASGQDVIAGMFSSANWYDHFWKIFWDPIFPKNYANYINPRIVSDLLPRGSNSYVGILAMDFVGKDSDGTPNSVVQHVYESNWNRHFVYYEWSEHYSQLTAREYGMMGRNTDPFENVTKNTTKSDDTATCEQPGTALYTADFSDCSAWMKATTVSKRFATPALGHDWEIYDTSNTGASDFYKTETTLHCKREGCKYNTGNYGGTPDALDYEYDGQNHITKILDGLNAKVDTHIAPLLTVLSKLEGASEYGTQMRNVGTYTLKIDTVPDVTRSEGERHPESYKTSTIYKRKVIVQAHDQIVKTGQKLSQNVDLATLIPAGVSELLSNIDLTDIKYSPDGAISEKGKITPSDAKITLYNLPTSEDVTNYFDITYKPGNLIVLDDNPIESLPRTQILTYNGTERALTTEGVIRQNFKDQYHFEYSLGDGNWSTEVPKATNPGTYNVQYKVVRNGSGNDSSTNNSLEIVPPQAIEVVINKRIVALNWTDSLEYNGQEQVATATVANTVGLDDVSVNVVASGASADQRKDAGSYVAEVASLSGADADKYDVRYNDRRHIYTITPKRVAISGKIGNDKDYDGTNIVDLNLGNAGIIGKVGNDDVTVTSCDATYDDVNVGDRKSITVTNVEFGGNDAHNYMYDASIGDTTVGDINPRTVELKWQNVELIYDGTSQCPTALVDNDILGDEVNVVVQGGQVNAGAYTAKATALTGSSADNYKLPNNSTFNYGIAPITAQVEWTKTIFKYDGQSHVPYATVTNLLPGDVCQVAVSGAQTKVGSDYTATAKSTNSNYYIPDDTTVNFSITDADSEVPIDVIIDPKAPKIDVVNLEKIAKELLTQEELNEIAAGADYEIYVEIKLLNEDEVPEADKNVLTAYTKENSLSIGDYLDISLWKRVGETRTQIHETPEPLEFMVDVPNDELSDTREYYLINSHNNVAKQVAKGTDSYIKASCSEFSTFMIAYVEEPFARGLWLPLTIIGSIGGVVIIGIVVIALVMRKRRLKK